MKNLLAVLILFSSAMVLSQAPASSGTPMPADKAFVLCKHYQSQYQGMQFDALWPKLSPKLQQLLKSPADAKATMEAAYKQIGHESKVLNERILPVPGSNLMQYTRLIETDAMPMQFMVYLAVDPDGIIQGIAIRKVDNPAESKYLDYKDKAA